MGGPAPRSLTPSQAAYNASAPKSLPAGQTGLAQMQLTGTLTIVGLPGGGKANAQLNGIGEPTSYGSTSGTMGGVY